MTTTITSVLRKLEFFRTRPEAKLPTQGHPSDVGWDLSALLLSETGKELTRSLAQRVVTPIPTGIIVRPPPGFYVQVCSRSGLAMQGIFVANAPGIVDPSYTGEIIVLLYNGSYEPKYVKHGNRVAQLVVAPIVPVTAVELKDRPKSSERGEAGFGSTGS